MSTSRDVFALRKAGQLNEAYRIAVRLNDVTDPDIWDMRALAWCLVDLVDLEISQENYQNLHTYCQRLERIGVDQGEVGRNTLTPSEDAALIARRKRALSLINQVKANQRNGTRGNVITYKDIYAKRKEHIDEAYHMALQATAGSISGEMELHALAWCLVDLIKRDFASGNYKNLETYRQQLQEITVDAHRNDVLAKQQVYALSMCDPSAPIIFQAQKYSKQENYAEAIRCYNKLYPNIPQKHQTSFGWDLYRYSRQLHMQGQHTIPQIKRCLQQYLTLDVKKPSRLHSCILWLAKETAKAGNLDLGAFLPLWGLDFFQQEDYERSIASDGRQYPALAEEAVQRACKAAVKSKSMENMQRIFPALENITDRYPDNIWLVYYKTKFLLNLDRSVEAQKYCRTVCKNKLNEFWAWELLGDTYGSDQQSALACYSKALLCPAEEILTIKLRRKTAQLLAKQGYYPQAKFEITVHENLNPNKRTQEIEFLTSQQWFHEATLPSSNTDFYMARANAAEDLLLADLPWLDAVAGETFTVPGKDGKPTRSRRRIYIQAGSFPSEESCSEKFFPYSNLPPGSPISVKGEARQDKPYQIFSIAQRESGTLWDIFSTHVGVITFINRGKHVYHILIKRGLETFFHFDQLDGRANEGDFVAATLSQFHDKQGKKYRIVSAEKTTQQPSSEIYKTFNFDVISRSGELGFTNSNIFIPPNIIRENNLEDGEVVSGSAILSYNKKRSEWGWKAISITKA